MENNNRKYLVVTVIDVNKREATKVTEVSDERLIEINMVANHVKKDNRYGSLGEYGAVIMNCLPLTYTPIYLIKEINVLAVIGEVKLYEES